MVRHSDLDHLLDAMLENQPWSEHQRGYYQAIHDMRDRDWRRSIFKRWYQDPMFILGVAAGAVVSCLSILILATIIA